LKQIEDNTGTIQVDKHLGILRDQSISWLWKAHQTLNKPEIVKKVLTLYYPTFWEMLRNLKTTDPKFWDELTKKTHVDPEEPLVGAELKADDILEPPFEDDSNLLCDVIVANVLGSESDGVEAPIQKKLHNPHNNSP
jgi:hypothetical protein